MQRNCRILCRPQSARPMDLEFGQADVAQIAAPEATEIRGISRPAHQSAARRRGERAGVAWAGSPVVKLVMGLVSDLDIPDRASLSGFPRSEPVQEVKCPRYRS